MASRPIPVEPASSWRRRVLPPGMTATEGALDLLPLPAAIVGVASDGETLMFEAVNVEFRQAGIGVGGDMSRFSIDHRDRIAAFLRSDIARETFGWSLGEVVEQRHFHVTLARIGARNEPRCLVTLIDQTGEIRTERNLRREMSTDSLTGLPNRAGFADRVELAIAQTGGAGEEAAQASGTRYAVLMIDLDRFSRVNACLGSLAGDELLITVARRIKGALRAGDILSRTGGDEFGILVAVDGGPEEAEHVAKRIAAALATPFRLSEYEIRVSVSIGIAHHVDGQADAEDLMRHAQFAVKRSKTSGRPEAYQTSAFAVAREEFGMETGLRRAIEAGALRLHYQPICDLSTGRVIAFEALARWTDEHGVKHSPSDFIPVAEESGLIVPLGRWAIREATNTLATWDSWAGSDCGVAVAVNLSAIQLQRDTVATVVADALRDSGLAGHRLKLELTESALVADPERVAQVLLALKALGTTLAMDDFGTGYSNLAYLQKLPIDILKIDRSFVTGMLADRDKIAIVRAILSLAQALGMETVAEGIETHELGQTLAALGCTYGQGYTYAQPLDADAAYAFLSVRNA